MTSDLWMLITAVPVTTAGLVGMIHKKSWGFIILSVANVGWITYLCSKDIYSQALVVTIFTCTNIIGYLKWKKHERLSDCDCCGGTGKRERS